jgi:acetylornithine deacetylase
MYRQSIEASIEELWALAADLVRIPTENRPPAGDEMPGQERLARECREAGLTTELYELDAVPGFRESPYRWPRAFTGRKNLIARWPGSGGGRSILFSGHMDVAPAYPLPWALHEPYEPVLEEGKLYGRGSADMKGGLAAALHAVKVLKRSGFRPRGDVLFESVVDEEFAGANGTLAARLRGDRADFAIVPEPTAMHICPASYGAKLAKITVTGPSGMPYGAHGVFNPVFGLGRVILALREFEKHWNRVAPFHPLYADERLNVIIYKVLAGDARPEGQMTVPPEAWLSVIIQTRPPTTEAEIDAALDRFLADRLKDEPGLAEHPPAIVKEYRYMEPADSPADAPGVRMLSGCAAALGCKFPVRGAPYSCDLFLFHRFGIPAVLVGPRGDNYHGRDEWVDADDLVKLSSLFGRAICTWCG